MQLDQRLEKGCDNDDLKDDDLGGSCTRERGKIVLHNCIVNVSRNYHNYMNTANGLHVVPLFCSKLFDY